MSVLGKILGRSPFAVFEQFLGEELVDSAVLSTVEVRDPKTEEEEPFPWDPIQMKDDFVKATLSSGRAILGIRYINALTGKMQVITYFPPVQKAKPTPWDIRWKTGFAYSGFSDHSLKSGPIDEEHASSLKQLLEGGSLEETGYRYLPSFAARFAKVDLSGPRDQAFALFRYIPKELLAKAVFVPVPAKYVEAYEPFPWQYCYEMSADFIKTLLPSGRPLLAVRYMDAKTHSAQVINIYPDLAAYHKRAVDTVGDFRCRYTYQVEDERSVDNLTTPGREMYPFDFHSFLSLLEGGTLEKTKGRSLGMSEAEKKRYSLPV